MEITLNERDKDRMQAIASYRGMSIHACAAGLIQQSMRSWEAAISERKAISDNFLNAE